MGKRDEYLANFAGDYPKDSKLAKAFEIACEVRKFEIELYWSRATYFWTLIAAAFVGYAWVYRSAVSINTSVDLWLPFVFSCLGLLFSIAWLLVNRGSKFWQNNWERQVDLLEDAVIGPLHKKIAKDNAGFRPYSVTKINEALSWVVSAIWVVLVLRSLGPISCDLGVDLFKIFVVVITLSGVLYLVIFAKSTINKTPVVLTDRELDVK
jgi:hypothetical protein